MYNPGAIAHLVDDLIPLNPTPQPAKSAFDLGQVRATPPQRQRTTYFICYGQDPPTVPMDVLAGHLGGILCAPYHHLDQARARVIGRLESNVGLLSFTCSLFITSTCALDPLQHHVAARAPLATMLVMPRTLTMPYVPWSAHRLSAALLLLFTRRPTGIRFEPVRYTLDGSHISSNVKVQGPLGLSGWLSAAGRLVAKPDGNTVEVVFSDFWFDYGAEALRADITGKRDAGPIDAVVTQLGRLGFFPAVRAKQNPAARSDGLSRTVARRPEHCICTCSCPCTPYSTLTRTSACSSSAPWIAPSPAARLRPSSSPHLHSGPSPPWIRTFELVSPRLCLVGVPGAGARVWAQTGTISSCHFLHR